MTTSLAISCPDAAAQSPDTGSTPQRRVADVDGYLEETERTGPVRLRVALAFAANELAPGHAPPNKRWVYLKHALVHPWHIVVFAGATVFGVANWSLLVLLLVFVSSELLLLAVVTQLPGFRRFVDERVAQIEHRLAAEQRAALLRRMSAEHVRELVRLEALVDRIRDGARRHGVEAHLAVDECLRLLASYVRLATAYEAARQCLASVDRQAIDDEVRAFEASRFTQGAAARPFVQRRLQVARKRAERWDRSRDALEGIAHQLSLIGELVQLAHERVMAPSIPDDVCAEIDRAREDLDDHQSACDELAEIVCVDDAIDPRMLDLGRRGAHM